MRAYGSSVSSTTATARFGLRSARRRSGRIAATVVAVGLATSLAVAAFGLAAQLDGLVGTANTAAATGATLPAGTLVVTAGTPGATEPTAISDELVERAASVDGVLSAAGTYEQPIAVRIPRGSQDERPPALRGLVFSSGWGPARWSVRSGTAPTDGDPLPVALDQGGSATAGASIGDRIRLQTPTGGVEAIVVALVEPAGTQGDDRIDTPDALTPDALAPGSVTPDPLPSGPLTSGIADAHIVVQQDALARVLGAQGRVDRITVTPLPGVDIDELTARLRAELPDDLELRAASDPVVEQARAISAVSDGIVTVTTAIAVVAALVAALLVANTLSIVAAQRRIEVALARCIGMSRRQIVGSFLVEGITIGVAATAVGIVVGVPLSLAATRAVYPDVAPTPVLTTTMAVVAALVGLGVTVVAAIAPAWQLARTPPLAALGVGRSRRARRSLLLVGVLPLLGLVRRAAGQHPVLRMAAAQPGRDPRRASAIVATLFVSLALVGAVLTISASIRTAIDEQFVSSSEADLYLRRRGVVRVDAAALEARLGAQGSRGYVDLSRVEGSLVGPAGTEPSVRSAPLDDAAALFELGIPNGSEAGRTAQDPTAQDQPAPNGATPDQPDRDDVGTGEALLSEASARTLGVRSGDLVTLRSTSGRDESVLVRGVYRNSALVGPALVDRASAIRVDAEGTFELAGIVLDERAPVDRVRGFIDRSIGGFNRLGVDTPAGFAATDTDIAVTVTRLVLVLLTGTLALGAVGAANNISLSVNERRRELAVLRAVGARRRQVRWLVSSEAVLLTAATGALGVVVGVALGAGAVRLAPAQFAASLVVPWTQIAVVVAVATLLGGLAAALPAAAAARRPPLQGLDAP